MLLMPERLWFSLHLQFRSILLFSSLYLYVFTFRRLFLPLLPSKKGESFVSPLFLTGLVFTRRSAAVILKKGDAVTPCKLSVSLSQTVMMTQQVYPGCLPRPPVRMWHRLRRYPMAAVTLAWPLAARRREERACRTRVSSVTSPSGTTFRCLASETSAGSRRKR